jgi:hypothetical protein
MSDKTIVRRIKEMSPDFVSQVIANIEEADFFAVQVDESTDI